MAMDGMADALSGAKKQSNTGVFSQLALAAQVVVTCLFFGARYDLSSPGLGFYGFYSGVAIMMFVGFGYLMTFLKAYGMGAIGFTMMITCLGIEWAMFLESAMKEESFYFMINMTSFMNAMFAVATVLISFGGLIGKISPTQVTMVIIVELVCYCANKVLFLEEFLRVADVGGTISIHVFGAYFGLACCAVFGKADSNGELNGSDYTSDRFSFLGTVFLWLYWPSFVAGAAATQEAQSLCITNTILALCASAVVTFGLTPLLSGGKLAPVSIQNATLAGGVAIGAVADLQVQPVGALLIGGIAGAISCVGFCKHDSLIPAEWDTCGINNLHGMPGIFGALVSVVCPLLGVSPFSATYQLAGLAGTLIFAGAAGACTGLLLKRSVRSKPFSDECFWECELGDHNAQVKVLP